MCNLIKLKKDKKLKKYLILFIIISVSLVHFGQCNGRYQTEIFNSVSIATVNYSSVYNDYRHKMDIYTADGDSEGTMGGLVRMGENGIIETVFHNAIENAKWCSADPVCTEIGKRDGQGLEKINLAACHNCCLLAETSCEEFNRLLDRGVLIDKNFGFFIK